MSITPLFMRPRRHRTPRPLDSTNREALLIASEATVAAKIGSPTVPIDRAAWGSIYAQHARMVYAIALARLAPADAEDVVQEVFMKAFDRVHELRDVQSTGPWLAAIARTVSIDLLRRSHRQKQHAITATMNRNESTSSSLPTSTGSPGARLEADDVLAAIQRLPDAYRETLVLRLVEGFTGPQIAEQLGMTHGSVRVNLCRGMEQLRALLGWEGAR